MTSAPPSERDRTFREEALPQMDAVYRFALRLTRDDERARDLVQETYLRAWQNWDRYTPGTRAKSWLFTISRNAFLRAEERTRRHTEIVAAESSAGGADEGGVPTVFRSVGDRDPEGTFWSQVVDEEVLRAIDALPAEFREAVVLSDLEDLSYEEIARIMEVPVGTVKSRLFRGRRLLQEALYDYAVEVGVIPAGRRDAPAEKEGEGR